VVENRMIEVSPITLETNAVVTTNHELRTLRVGMIGAGFSGRTRSVAYAAMPIAYFPSSVIPIRDTIAAGQPSQRRDEENAQNGQNGRPSPIAASYGFNRFAASWQSIVEDPSIDIIDIATSHDAQVEITIAAAAAGKHIMCQLPLAATPTEAELMYSAVRNAGVRHMIGVNYRRLSAVTLAKRYIAEGSIGTVLNFRGTYPQSRSAYPVVTRSLPLVRHTESLAEAGAHVIDVARFLVGEIAAVNAVFANWLPERPLFQESEKQHVSAYHFEELAQLEEMISGRSGSSLNGSLCIDEEVMTLLRFENGAVGSLSSTGNRWSRDTNRLTFEINGSLGSLIFDGESHDHLHVCFAGEPGEPSDRYGFKTVYSGPADSAEFPRRPTSSRGFNSLDTKVVEVYELCRAIVEDRPASPDFRDGAQIAAITHAISESAAKEIWMAVPNTR
jgi:predicted dehydrogenase